MKGIGVALLLCCSLVAAQAPQTGYKLIPHDRWGTQPLGGPIRYPKLAAIARISGEVITAVVINKAGKAEQIKSLTGPVQLRAAAEALVQTIKFKLTPDDGDGPWLFFVTSQFNLDNNDAYCIATPKEKIPFDLLKRSTAPTPDPRAS